MKTSELTGAALDWAVAKCEGAEWSQQHSNYSTNWTKGGLILERAGISIGKVKAIKSWHWIAGFTLPSKSPIYGPTPLIAAMRCYVASKLGDNVDIPGELL